MSPIAGNEIGIGIQFRISSILLLRGKITRAKNVINSISHRLKLIESNVNPIRIWCISPAGTGSRAK